MVKTWRSQTGIAVLAIGLVGLGIFGLAATELGRRAAQPPQPAQIIQPGDKEAPTFFSTVLADLSFWTAEHASQGVALAQSASTENAAEEPYCQVSLPNISNAPRFEDYPARPARTSRRRPIPDGPLRHELRVALRDEAARSPNFAGNATIVTWGCGSGCFEWAIVNGRTGRVYSPPDEVRTHFGPTHFTDAALHFRRDSRLVVAVGSHLEFDPDSRPRETWHEGAYFMLWTGRSLRPIRVVPVTALCPDAGPPLVPSSYNDRYDAAREPTPRPMDPPSARSDLPATSAH